MSDGLNAMDNTDRRLLNIIQKDFPICERPFESLGDMLGITEEEALKRTRALADAGLIRRIGASFDSGALRHVSTLVAAKVPLEKLDRTVEIINSYAEVTHNYGRDFEYNLWFTILCEDSRRLESIIEEIKAKTGISDMHSLPAERRFKIRVDFEL